jgi:hypothetical protein
MSGLGTLSRTIQIVKATQVHIRLNAFRKEMLQNPSEWKSIPGIPGEIERKINVVNSLIIAAKIRTLNDQEILQILQSLNEVQGLLNLKFTLEGVGIFANTLTVWALYLFVLGSVTAVPFLLLASSFLIRIGSLAYQDLT